MSYNGIISKFFKNKNFGFIREDESGDNYFFHTSALGYNLNAENIFIGQHISFELMLAKKGDKCVNIQIIDYDDDDDEYDDDDDDYDDDDYLEEPCILCGYHFCICLRDNDNYENYENYDNYDDEDDYDSNNCGCSNNNIWIERNIECARCGSYKTIEKNNYCKCLNCGAEGYC